MLFLFFLVSSIDGFVTLGWAREGERQSSRCLLGNCAGIVNLHFEFQVILPHYAHVVKQIARVG